MEGHCEWEHRVVEGVGLGLGAILVVVAAGIARNLWGGRRRRDYLSDGKGDTILPKAVALVVE